MSRSTSTRIAVGTASGLPFSTFLTILFIVLKLTGVITWSWLWVFAPSLFVFGVTVLVLGGAAMAALFILIVSVIVAILE